jgi:mono/diheme cytochrome c family protein
MRLIRNSQGRVFGNRLLLAGLIVATGVLLVLAGWQLFAPQKPPAPSQAGSQPGASAEDIQLATGQQLYGNYCAACHGEKGDGNGPAAKYVYPRPRNFGEAKFRLVTTVNSQPSDQDLLQVITRGMPGSAMFPFAHLSASDRQALVAHVRQLTRSSFIEQYRQGGAQRGETVDLEELGRDVDQFLQPGPTLEVPSIYLRRPRNRSPEALSCTSKLARPATAGRGKAMGSRSSATTMACPPAPATSPAASSRAAANLANSTPASC